MEKRFIYAQTKAAFVTANTGTGENAKYYNSVVFIKDSGEIYTHGQFFGLSNEWQNKITAAENDIDALQTAVAALQSTYSFTTISDGTNNASATATAKTIKFTGSGKASVTVGSDGVTISAAGTTLAEGTANGLTSVDGTSKKIVKGLDTAAYHPDTYFYTATEGAAAKKAADNAQATADAKVASVAATANAGIAIGGTATAPTVGLKIDTTTAGNVTLSTGANGLKANVTIPAATITGVKSGEKVLSLTNKELTTTLSLAYNSTTKKIQLLGVSDAVVAELDATAFIKDGMISEASYDPTSKTLSLSFNTDSGVSDPIEVDLSDLVDTYTAGNGISITSNKVEIKKDSASESFLSVSASGLKLSGVQDAINTAKNAVLGSTTDTASANTVYGAKKYADSLASNYATSAQGTKADTAIQTVRAANTGTYISVAAAKSGTTINLTPSVTVKSVASATTTSNGLAEAADVKAYADGLIEWEEL